MARLPEFEPGKNGGMSADTLKNLLEVENSAPKFGYALHLLLAEPRGDRGSPGRLRCPLQRGWLRTPNGRFRRGRARDRMGRLEQRSQLTGVGAGGRLLPRSCLLRSRPRRRACHRVARARLRRARPRADRGFHHACKRRFDSRSRESPVREGSIRSRAGAG